MLRLKPNKRIKRRPPPQQREREKGQRDGERRDGVERERKIEETAP